MMPNRLGTRVELARSTPPGMRACTGRLPSVMDFPDHLLGRQDIEC